jgi:DnaK suppressor protein
MARYVHHCGISRREKGGNGGKVTTQEIEVVLFAKLRELTSRQIRREDIAIEKNAEEMDEIQQGSDRALALDSLTRKWETTALVSEALERVESDTYGICVECDEQIGPKRLAAIPWAKYCIRCQEQKDNSISDVRWDNAA